MKIWGKYFLFINLKQILSLLVYFNGGTSGDRIDIESDVYDLGLSGTGLPILIGSSYGSFNDSTLIADTAISVSINGAHWGGSIYLDDFHFQGIKSSDSCLTATGIHETPIENSDFTYDIQNSMLHITTKNDFKNGEFEIMSVSGQKILASKLTSPTSEFDLSQFSGGLYLIHFRTPEKNYTAKFLLTK